MPKVSIILTSYNHEKYIAAAIESVLNQTFSDFELLIFDDGSTDNSHEVIKTFKDERIKLFLNDENTGAVQMLQAGAKISKGQYIALQHSDDVWELDKIEKQLQFLENHPEYEACFTQAKFIDESGEIYDLPEKHHYKNIFKQKNRSREEWLNHLFWKMNCFCHPSILARNHPQYFIHNPRFFQLPDYFTWVNLLLKKNIYVMEEELIKFRLRRGEQNSVSSLNLEKAIRVNNEEYFAAREFLPIIQDKEFFLKVFPEARKFLMGKEINTAFAFAQLCFEKTSLAFQKLALEILYDLIHNENDREQIKKLYDYDEKSFIEDTGRIDSFSIKSQLKILNCRLYIDFGENFKESDALTKQTMIRMEKNFAVSFDFQSDKKIVRLRFDPDDKITCTVKIDKFFINGEIVNDFISNAIQIIDGYFYFLGDDPYFVVNKEIPAGKIHIEIVGVVKKSLPPIIQDIEDALLGNSKADGTLQKIKRKLLMQILKTR